jgi:hypothetical protein
VVLVLTGTDQTREVAMNELVQVQEVIEGVIVEGCELGYSNCTDAKVELVEDPYESDVNNNPGQLIMACPECLHDLYLAI